LDPANPAPGGPEAAIPAADVRLDDRYTADRGRILLNGTQALLRLLLVQRRRDLAAGLNTAGFVSGYRGSPLGGLDQALWQSKALLDAAPVHFQPGVNEDLAATAVWGTQQAASLPATRVDGIYALWYGKGPGVDRSGDPVRHANRQGTSRHGGVLMAFGDDHGAKSSTVTQQSEPLLAGLGVPVLYPATVQEILDLGLHGWALSRFAGTWSGFKCVNEILETTATAEADHAARVRVVLPDETLLPAGERNGRLAFDPVGEEARLVEARLPAVLAYARANRLDRVEFGRPGARLGLVSAGKAAVDVRQALALLGLDEADAEALGLALYRPRLIWPLEPEGIAAFARGCDELLVVEEKLPFVEPQVASALFNLPAAERPRLLGKRDLDGSPLVPAHGQLDPVRLARLIGARLLASEAPPPGLAERLERLDRRPAAASPGTSSTHRLPYFCAGCPHNTSTKVPEGSIALSGIGCHTMALWMDRDTLPPTQMGGEGANWNGIAPFSDTPHLFQNIGDGTYAHSGLLAIRAAAAAGTRITYKLLYNDAVAMTGGQPVEGSFTVADIARQLLAEKVQRVVVVSDEPHKYLGALALPPGVDAFHRNRLDEVQRELREIQGTTVLIYDQACATEKRRRRKRGRLVEPDRAVFINHRVCEGCGDCSVQANCVALTSRETPFGRKRQVDQSVCNKDYSCLRGFCPALVTVEGGRRRRPAAAALPEGLFADLPSPTRFDGPCNVLVTGIGGTGVVTVGALLSTAAHLDGLVAQAFDLTGLAQKNGAVFSHLRLGGPADGRRTARLGPGESDLLLGCDLVVAASDDAVASCDPERTRAVVNTAVVPTAQLQLDPDVDFHTDELLARVETAVSGHVDAIDAAGNARRLLGDTIGSNLFLVGVALQRGLLPVTLESLERAIELNGVAVDLNRNALRLGRLAAHAPERLAGLGSGDGPAATQPDELDALLALFGEELVAYQDPDLAAGHRALVERVAETEHAVAPGMRSLSHAVARTYFHLLAHKDEYEVARLHADPAFTEEIAAQFEGDYRIVHHLSPPWLGRPDPRTGRTPKRAFGPWLRRVFPWLARFGRLRGTLLDPFRGVDERREARQLVQEYEALVKVLLDRLDDRNHAEITGMAEMALSVRGYGPVRSAAVAAYRAEVRKRLAALDESTPLDEAA
jgi:indolepyruvate ferredoxin oxidoreductase